MKDTIIKGDGTSRKLQAPATMPETYAEWRQQLLDGDATLDIGLNAEGCDVVGTALNKSNLLKDATAQALGVASADPNVDDAFNAIPTIAGQIAEQKAEDAAAGRLLVDEVVENSWMVDVKQVPAMINYRLFYVNDRFISVPSSSTNSLSFSTDDAKTWQQGGSLNIRIEAVCYGNGVYVAMGASTNGSNTSTAYYSTDCVNWTSTSLPQSGNISSIVYGNGVFVATGSNGLILFSSNGINWTKATSPTSELLLYITFANNRFLAFSSSYILVSEDGVLWTSRSTPVSSQVYGCFYLNNRYFAIASNGTVFVSANATTWTTATLRGETLPTSIRAVFYKGNIVILFSNKLYYSTDGEYWQVYQSSYYFDSTKFVANDKFILNYYSSPYDSRQIYYDWLRPRLMQNGSEVTPLVQSALDKRDYAPQIETLESTTALLLDLAAEHEERLCMMELGI